MESFAEIKQWYARQNFTKTYVQSFQKVVGTEPDGAVGKNTISAVQDWQKRNQLTADGKFGNACAKKANLSTPNAAKTSKQTTIPTTNPTGKGINPKPGFDKQYNYKTSPYVSKSHYNEMNAAMKGASYSSWDINSKALSGIYNRAVKSNGGKTTISSSGCGITSYANLKGISPKAAAEMAMKSSYRVYGAGTAAAFFESNGGSATDSKQGLEAIKNNGKYLISSMKKGHWTSGNGHFILAYGYDGNNVYISDPASASEARHIAPASTYKRDYKYGYLF